jgi:hypothetical protein
MPTIATRSRIPLLAKGVLLFSPSQRQRRRAQRCGLAFQK